VSQFCRFQLLEKQTSFECRIAGSQENGEAGFVSFSSYIPNAQKRISFISMYFSPYQIDQK
jgi:hypothetical protein